MPTIALVCTLRNLAIFGKQSEENELVDSINIFNRLLRKESKDPLAEDVVDFLALVERRDHGQLVAGFGHRLHDLRFKG